MPILRPLLTWDKDQTVALAERIGTMAVSKHEVPDSCTVFAPTNPATAAAEDRVLREESRLDIAALLGACAAVTNLICTETLERSCVPELTAHLSRLPDCAGS
jgi:thiamine biosynthesis protein ThiI